MIWFRWNLLYNGFLARWINFRGPLYEKMYARWVQSAKKPLYEKFHRNRLIFVAAFFFHREFPIELATGTLKEDIWKNELMDWYTLWNAIDHRTEPYNTV